MAPLAAAGPLLAHAAQQQQQHREATAAACGLAGVPADQVAAAARLS